MATRRQEQQRRRGHDRQLRHASSSASSAGLEVTSVLLAQATTRSGTRSSPESMSPCPVGQERRSGALLGELERLADALDRLWRLEQHLRGRVGDDRLPELGGEEVAGVLGDGGEAAPALARSSPGGRGSAPGRLAHQEPGLVDEHAALSERSFERAPDRVEPEQEHGRLEALGPAERSRRAAPRPCRGRARKKGSASRSHTAVAARPGSARRPRA